MKRILLVSFYFPPIMSAGSVRMGKFAKYLPGFGWEPFILTVDPKDNLVTGVPVEVEERWVFRTPYLDPVGVFSMSPKREDKRSLRSKPGGSARKGWVREWAKRVSPFTIQRMPDRMLGWYPYAVRTGGKIAKWDRIDAVFSSHPSPVSHLIAARLSRRFGVPWIADYRDLWSGSLLRPYPMWLDAAERRFEKRLLSGASAITTVSGALRDYLVALHKRPVEVIPNGYDPDDFRGEASRDRGPRDRFVMVYSGTLYTEKQSPVPLFEAVKALMDRGVVDENKLRIRFIGVQTPLLDPLVEKYGLSKIVVTEPFQPYQENIATLKKADGLLFFSWNGGEMAGNLISKIFQYVGSGSPVLVVGDQDKAVTEFIEATRTGVVGKNSSEIADILERWLEEFTGKGNLGVAPDETILERYSRKRQAEALAELLDRSVS